jgi:hypothetical protein
LWDSWLRRDSLKAIGRTFGKPSLLFIAGWPPVLRRPVEITTQNGHSVSCSGLLIHPGTQVATSHCINLRLIDAPKEEGE